MAEYIVSGPSSRSVLKAKGKEVITRCKECGSFKVGYRIFGYQAPAEEVNICEYFGCVAHPEGYCWKGWLREDQI